MMSRGRPTCLSSVHLDTVQQGAPFCFSRTCSFVDDCQGTMIEQEEQ